MDHKYLPCLLEIDPLGHKLVPQAGARAMAHELEPRKSQRELEPRAGPGATAHTPEPVATSWNWSYERS
jgi:hypothetical protein